MTNSIMMQLHYDNMPLLLRQVSCWVLVALDVYTAACGTAGM